MALQQIESSTGASRAGEAQQDASTLLRSPAFVVAVGLLALNDHVLKAAIGGWWTGKLSDLAGLFAFPLFWMAFFPLRWRRPVYAFTAAGFLIWKSPLSEPLLSAWNAFGFWPVARVLDYSDWLALAILLPSYYVSCGHARHGRAEHPRVSQVGGRLARRLATIILAGFAIMTFTATSRVAMTHVPPGEGGWYALDAPKREVRAQLDSLGRDVYVRGPRTGAADTLAVRFGDTVSEHQHLVRIELRATADGGSVVTLLQTESLSSPSAFADVKRAFLQQVIEPLQARLTARSRLPAR